MTITYVRGASNAVDGSGTTIAASYATNDLGNLLVAGIGWIDTTGATNVTSVTDAQGNTWVARAGGKTRNASQTYSVQLFYKLGCAARASANAVTVTFSGATTFTRLAIGEWHSSVGPFTSAELDATAVGTGSGTAIATATLTPTAANEILVCVGSAGGGTLTAGTGFTKRMPTTANSLALCDQIQTTLTAVTCKETTSSSSQWCIQGLSFKDAAPSATIGTLSAAFGALSATLTGTPKVTGTTSAAFAPVAFTFVGRPTVKGTTSAAFGAVTATITGRPVVVGTLAAPFGALSATWAGRPTVRGTIAVTPAFVAALTGTGFTPSGLTAHFGGLVATLAGSRTSHGSLTAAPLAALSATFTGAPTVHGTLAAPLGGLVATVTGKRKTTGTASAAFGFTAAWPGLVFHLVNGTMTATFGGLSALLRGAHINRYDPAKLKVRGYAGSAKLGWTFRLGESLLGDDSEVQFEVPVSSVTVGDGYTIGPNGELSLDPSTATAVMATHEDAPVPNPDAGYLRIGDPIEVTYGQVVQFKGRVTKIAATLTPDPVPPHRWTRRTAYTFQTAETVALSTVVDWVSLPAESALVRLQRWFTVDTSHVAAAHLTALDVLMAAEPDPGEASMIDLARAFTAATLIPLRLASYWNQEDWTTLAAFDQAADWVDQPLVMTPGRAYYADASTEVSYSEDVAGELAATGLTLRTDDVRLTGAGSSTPTDYDTALVPDQLGGPSDTFHRSAVTAGWGVASAGGAWSVVSGAAARFSTDGNKGLISANAVNTELWINGGTPASADVDLQMRVATSVLALTQPINVYLTARYANASNNYRCRFAFNPDASISMRFEKMVAGVLTSLGAGLVAQPAVTHVAGAYYWCRFRITGTTLEGKAWKEGTTEPAGWTITQTDAALSATGAMGVRAVLTTGNTNTLPVVVSVDDVTTSTGYTPFRLGVSRLGSPLHIQVGFLAGGVVDVFGTAYPVARISQTFGTRHYSASLELAPRLALTP